MFQQATFMNDIQIDKARRQGELIICPYNENNLTPVGYNLSFSRFIISLRKRAFIKIEHERDKWFFYLKPHETVLVLTRETIWVSKFIGGTFHSKVSLVTKGLGHVSTTIDPGWHGQLLVPLNNPTKGKIKIVIAHDGENGKIFETFITMVLFRSQEASLTEKSDNKSARIELLEEILEENKRKNRDAQYLWEFIQKLKASVGTMEVFADLNDPTDRKEKIKIFQREHIKMITEMDNEFERINKFSCKMYNKRRVGFGVTIMAILTVFLSIIVCVYVKGNRTSQDIVIGFVAVISPFISWALGYVSDKYI